MTLTEQRIAALKQAGVIVRDDCLCGLCVWAHGDDPIDEPHTVLAKRRKKKPTKKPGRAPVP